MLRGDIFVCGAHTEPSGGSDSANVATTARLENGEWVINGAKQFITNAGTPATRYISTLCRTGSLSNGKPELSTILVPVDAAGVEVGPSYEKMGWRSSDTHPVFFHEVHVAEEMVLGGRGSGHRETLKLLTWARIAIAALSTGLAQGCLEATHRFVTERASFGRPLYEHQVIAHEVANIAALTHLARTVTYDACWKRDNGYEFGQEAAICKLVASELANKIAYKATQLHGGYGFMDEYEVTRHYRDARVLTIGEGTSEIQRLLIARTLGFPS
jgi:alkylation response protein AidB-like acyl-CoA dehydrogenase